MLNFKKFVFYPLIIISLNYGQSILNGYGFGLRTETFDASSQGISSYGLVPSFNSNVSLQNPSTWQNLDFTYFQSSFNLRSSTVLEKYYNSDFSIGNVLFVVPIKGKYSFGLGIQPYLNQYYLLEGANKIEFQEFGDTLTMYHSFESFGGMSSFNVSGSATILENINFSIQGNFLYGSARQQTIFTLDTLDYYSQQRYYYSGILAGFYLNSDILSNLNIPLRFYTSINIPVKPVSTTIYYYKPFEDTDDSGYQDSSDLPSSSDALDATKDELDDILIPYEYQFGADFKLRQNTYISGEFTLWKDESNIGSDFSRLYTQIRSRRHASLGIAMFSSDRPQNLADKISYRLGIYSNLIKTDEQINNVKEYGVSAGLGFNFGTAKNQIDLAYSYGKREGLIGIGDENVQKFSIGITVGDIWFVKRRPQ